jgi:hypothetical protein
LRELLVTGRRVGEYFVAELAVSKPQRYVELGFRDVNA